MKAANNDDYDGDIDDTNDNVSNSNNNNNSNSCLLMNSIKHFLNVGSFNQKESSKDVFSIGFTVGP